MSRAGLTRRCHCQGRNHTYGSSVLPSRRQQVSNADPKRDCRSRQKGQERVVNPAVILRAMRRSNFFDSPRSLASNLGFGDCSKMACDIGGMVRHVVRSFGGQSARDTGSVQTIPHFLNTGSLVRSNPFKSHGRQSLGMLRASSKGNGTETFRKRRKCANSGISG